MSDQLAKQRKETESKALDFEELHKHHEADLEAQMVKQKNNIEVLKAKNNETFIETNDVAFLMLKKKRNELGVMLEHHKYRQLGKPILEKAMDDLKAENSSLKAASTLAQEEIDARDATIKTSNEQLRVKGDELVAVQKSEKDLTAENKKLKEASEHAKEQMATQANTILSLQAQLEQTRIATARLPKVAGVQTPMPGLIDFGKLSVQQAEIELGLEVAKGLTFHKKWNEGLGILRQLIFPLMGNNESEQVAKEVKSFYELLVASFEELNGHLYLDKEDCNKLTDIIKGMGGLLENAVRDLRAVFRAATKPSKINVPVLDSDNEDSGGVEEENVEEDDGGEEDGDDPESGTYREGDYDPYDAVDESDSAPGDSEVTTSMISLETTVMTAKMMPPARRMLLARLQPPQRRLALRTTAAMKGKVSLRILLVLKL